MHHGDIICGQGDTPITIPTAGRPSDLVVTAESLEPPHCGSPAPAPTVTDVQITDTGFSFVVHAHATARVHWRYSLAAPDLTQRWKHYLDITHQETAAAVLVLAEVLQDSQPEEEVVCKKTRKSTAGTKAEDAALRGGL